ncbi:MAG TPA: diaminopimelate decarboxylase [Actinomycetota bacterium]
MAPPDDPYADRERTPEAFGGPGALGPLERILPPSATVESSRLVIADCDAVELAERFGTPLYVYDEDSLRYECRELAEAMLGAPDGSRGLIAIKAFPSVAMAAIAREAGLGILCSTGGEHAVATAAAVEPEHLVLHGNNKSEDELRLAVSRLVVDSFDEIDRIERFGVAADVWIRVTPGVEAGWHEFIRTGGVDSKFGIAAPRVVEAAKRLAALPGVTVRGLHAHVGSQLLGEDETGLREVMVPMLRQTEEALGTPVRELDLGGGMGIAYTVGDPDPLSPADTARKLLEGWPADVALTLEPGRALVGRAGISLHRIGTVKEIEGVRTYVAVDGGMSDNIRTALYGAQYEFLLANRADHPGSTPVRIVGKHCESGDVLAFEARLPEGVRPGEVLVTAATGAYCYAMSSNYNVVPRPAVVLCRDGVAREVIRRETTEDLLRLQQP